MDRATAKVFVTGRSQAVRIPKEFRIIKHHPPEVKQRLGTLSVGEVVVSSVVIAELWYGIAQSTSPRSQAARRRPLTQHGPIYAMRSPGQASIRR